MKTAAISNLEKCVFRGIDKQKHAPTSAVSEQQLVMLNVLVSLEECQLI